MSITLEVKGNSIKVFIDGLIHIAIKKDELIGIQSWVHGYDEKRKWYIEFTTNTTTIESEYDTIDKWQTILRLLNEVLLW